MIREELINEFITNHVFPHFREVKHSVYADKYFSVGLNDYDRVAMISPFDGSLTIATWKWVSLQSMFSLTEDETKTVLNRWFHKNIPLLHFNGITLLRYP